MSIVLNPISPVAVSIFGFDIRWYALAYVAAFVVGAWMVKKMVFDNKSDAILTKKQFDDLFTAVVLGTIIGGRLGYVLLYNLPFFIENPLEIIALWNGGMAFHGGMLGVVIFVFLLGRRASRENKLYGYKNYINRSFKIIDILAVVAPIGLFFGRIANFINMEVMGRPTDKPWGIIFNGHDTIARHASPLYEAATEGLLLFAIMFCLWRFTKLRENVGALSGAFAIGYAIFRIFCEQFRAPDVQIGFLTSWGLTMGQLLSAGMFLAGAVIFAVALNKFKK